MSTPEEVDVLVVGAGPVGLAAALALKARGLTATVVEEGAADRVRPGSRAIFIHGASLKVLERVKPGLGLELAKHGLVFHSKRTFYRGREIYHRSFPAPPAQGIPAATCLPQVETEKVLLAACKEAGVRFVWSTPTARVTPGSDRVLVESAAGPIFSARYVIGADGARSKVRETAGLALEGPRTSNAFVIVDVTEDESAPLPIERVFHYEHPAVGGRHVLLVPFAGHWRADIQCHASDDPEAWSSPDGLRSWLTKVMPPKYADRVTWVSTYIFRQAIANQFADQSRRVLLAGEAAHIFAPFGARGLNSGIPDVVVAADAIAKALAAPSSDAARQAIDHFARTRRVAAERNRAASSTALHHMTAPTFGKRIERRLAGALAPHVESVAKWLDRAPYGPQLGPPDEDGMQY